MYTSYLALLKDIQQNGEEILPSNVSVNRSFVTKELTNVQLMIEDFHQLLLDDAEVKYYETELQWYFDSYEKPAHEKIDLTHEKWDKHPAIKPDTFLKELRQMAEDVLGAKNRCGPNSNYGEMCLRLENHMGVTQLGWVVERLKRDRASRQAVAFYNSPNYQYYSNEDFVCCLTQMFNIKGNKLNTIVNSRSNDLINSFRFDSIWWRIFQKRVLDELKMTYPNLELGYLLVNIFSAHYYMKDEFKIQKIEELQQNGEFKSISKEYL